MRKTSSNSTSVFAAARSGAAVSLVALALATPGVAFAQEEPAADEDNQIIVTGTILRGAAPVGSNLISVGQEKIAETGATTANELLATVPQVTNLFNTVPNSRLTVAVNQIQVVRPNLRNLSTETTSSASTLVLFDGHRIAPVGVTQNAVDPDLIPGIAIERVEVVTDGGSATYGSDAVGGVINFITRKRFDGVKVQGRYGIADNYKQYEAGAIVGKDWGSGSLFAAYNYQHNDAIFGRDRDWIKQVDWLKADTPALGRQCSPGNVQIGTNNFALPSLAAGANACDPSDDSSFIPRSTRHGALVGLHQELADWLTVDIRGFYGERKSTALAPFRGQATLSGVSSPGFPPFLPPSFRNFYYTPVPGQSANASQTVFFSLAPLLGRNTARSRASFEEGGVNAEFTASLNDNWQLRTLINYSESNSEFHLAELNQNLLNAYANGTTAAATVNFYNPGAGSADAANIAALVNNERAGQGKEQLFNARGIVDGTLFSLPGGEVKLAVGYEYIHDGFRQRTTQNTAPGVLETLTFSRYNRHINSVFGEVQVPIVGPEQDSFIHSLTLAGSVRYDDYSDVGDTTNPKVGVTLKPVAWFGLRGNYSTSFNAPSPVDQLGVLRNTVQRFPFNQPFVRPGDTPTAIGLVAIQGSNPGLRPQTADIYSFGFDVTNPTFLQGFNASASYYNVKFKDRIGIPSPSPAIYANFPGNITSAPGGVPLATVTAFINNSGAPNSAATLTTVTNGCTNPAACSNVYAIIDFRQGNYGKLDVEGIDFNASYRVTTGFGAVDAGVAGNYTLSRKSQTGAGAAVINELRAYSLIAPNGSTLTNTSGASRLQLSASLGADVGNFRAQATLNHSSGFGVFRCDTTTTPVCNPSATGVPTQSGRPQDRVGAFDTVNLFFKYAVPADSGVLSDLELTLNVNNVFDTDPPVFKEIGQNGYANGFTLGRLVQFGISKKF